MRTAIWFRILIVIDLVVVAAAIVIGSLSSEIAGRVVEERLIRETARRTGEFLRTQNLPFSDTLMGYLKRMHGADFVTIRPGDGVLVGSSFPSNRTDQLRRKAGSLGACGTVDLGDLRYRFDSHEIRTTAREFAGRPERLRLYAFVPREEFEEAKTLASERIAKLTVPVVLAASILALALALTVTRPIGRLSAEMRALAEEKRAAPARLASANGAAHALPAARLARRGPREIVDLARSFDRLMARLAKAQGDLARHERQATMGRIAASVVHELRNPLSGIRMNLRVLQEELGERGIREESLQASLREVERMALYLDELTDLASGPADPGRGSRLRLDAVAQVRLQEAADSVLALFTGRCRHSGVQVRTRYDPSAGCVRADPGRLRQVLINFVVNALDAMPSGGTLEVSVEPADDGRVRCTVADTGGGVGRGGSAEVFEPFVTTKSGSAGLGLYVCKRIVEAHGGTIGYRDAGRGAAFWFEIPND